MDDAARKIDIPKKSLDDYLLQLRFGRKFEFDFNKHKDSRVGVLRAFVKKRKQEEKLAKQKRKEFAESTAESKELKSDTSSFPMGTPLRNSAF